MVDSERHAAEQLGVPAAVVLVPDGDDEALPLVLIQQLAANRGKMRFLANESESEQLRFS